MLVKNGDVGWLASKQNSFLFVLNVKDPIFTYTFTRYQEKVSKLAAPLLGDSFPPSFEVAGSQGQLGQLGRKRGTNVAPGSKTPQHLKEIRPLCFTNML